MSKCQQELTNCLTWCRRLGIVHLVIHPVLTMRCRLLLLFGVVGMLAAGCARPLHVSFAPAVPEPFPPTSPRCVAIYYSDPPIGYDIIGVVEAEAGRKDTPAAVRKALTVKAAEGGADGIILTQEGEEVQKAGYRVTRWSGLAIKFHPIVVNIPEPRRIIPPLPMTVTKVLVEKGARQLTLLSHGRVVRRYSISLGRNPEGPKIRQGDGKTPEGTYVIEGRNANSRFHRALRISYPNEDDIRRAEQRDVPPGGDIMIHGLREDLAFIGDVHRMVQWTDGCIAVTNKEIEEIWRLVPDGTVVEIKP